MLSLFNPFGLFESAIRGAAGGIAHDLEPDEPKHDAPAAPPPPAPVAAPPPAPPLKTIRKVIRPLGLAPKPKHSTAFYVAAGAGAAVAVIGGAYLAFGRRA